MDPKSLQQTIDEMRRYIEREVRAGFHRHNSEEITDMAMEVFADDHAPEVLQPIAERLAREVLEAHLVAQAEWPPITDCDLLDQAFEELERAGIVARQNFTCCRT